MEQLRLSLLLTVTLFLFPAALKTIAAETGSFIGIRNFENNDQTAPAALTTGGHPLSYRWKQRILKMSDGAAILPSFHFPANFARQNALFFKKCESPYALVPAAIVKERKDIVFVIVTLRTAQFYIAR